MTTHITSISNGSADVAGSRPDRPARNLLALVTTFWREFAQAAFASYHPERHYMRGPGPACAAKRKMGN